MRVFRPNRTLPKPHQSDDHAYVGRTHKTIIQLSTDGFSPYPDAVDYAFGPYVKYGTIIKQYRDEMSGRYAPPKMKKTHRTVLKGSIAENTICTSHVERHNGTIRTFMKRFTRLSMGFSKNSNASNRLWACFWDTTTSFGGLVTQTKAESLEANAQLLL